MNDPLEGGTAPVRGGKLAMVISDIAVTGMILQVEKHQVVLQQESAASLPKQTCTKKNMLKMHNKSITTDLKYIGFTGVL